jgi:VWFA-related protein
MSNCGKCTRGSKQQNKMAGCWPAFLFLILLASTTYGQTVPGSVAGSAPASSEIPSSPTVTSNVDEVSLDLIVHDKNRKPIRDLKPEDLSISDNDAPVTLKGLHLVSADSGAEHLVTMVFDDFDGPTAKNAQNIADKILKVIPSNGYSFSVLDFTGRLRLIQGFSDDRDTIRQAVRLVTENPQADRTPVITLAASNLIVKRAIDKPDDTRSVAASLAEKNLIAIARTGADTSGSHVDVKLRARYQSLLSALEGARQIRQDQHALPTLAGLLALVRSQQKLPARKSLIYFTENTQLDSAAKEMVHTIEGAANQAGVILYVVDMNALDVGGQHQIDNAMASQNVAFNPGPAAVAGSGGMATSTPMQQRGAMSEGGSNVGMAVDWLRQSDKHPFTEIKSPLADMAKNTGGAYIDAQDNIKRPLRQMVEDMTTYYQASYVPPITEYDGSFHTIVAKPKREGLNLKTKTGYFAVASRSEGVVRPFEAPLLKLISQPQLPTDLKFHAAIVHFGELPDGNTSTVAVEVPISALEVKKDPHTNLFSAHVSVVAEIRDNSGTVVEHFGEDITRRGAIESLDKDPSASISLQRHFLAVPGRYTLEVAVLDRSSEKAGAQRISFEIPPAQSSPSLSEIVLVRKVETFREDDDPLEPMRYEKGRIIPSLSGEVPEDAKSVSLFFILHPDPKSKESPTLQMIASRNGRPGRRTPLPLRLENAGSTAPYLANFNSKLAPGDYEVKAILTQDGRTAVQSLSFTVEGDKAATAAPAPANGAPEGYGDASVGANAAFAGTDATANGMLAITAITNPVPPPSQDEIKRLIADARDRALHYVESLPNFMCIEVTNRSIDPTGTGKWKLRDTISELLHYRDKAESRTMLEVNGKSDSTDREGMKGTFSSGELGGVLKAVFLDSAKADFEWKETDSLGSGTLQVFNYRVAQSNSVFSVVGKNDKQLMVSFHGQLFIDSATRDVRRITLIADDLPRDFPTHYTSVAVDYDYVAINSHDYLMPINAEVRLLQGRHEAVLNTMEFRNYRRFGSNMRIVDGFTPVERP